VKVEVLKTIQEWKELQEALVGQSVGLVPTMGNLHEGHLSILKKSCEENDVSVLTIFVNPKQFGEGEDFKEYPRTVIEDIAKIKVTAERLKKRIFVFVPDNSEMYPRDFQTVVAVPSLSAQMEGEFRPTHFDGVTTVCMLLLNIFQPTKAYFGQKDYQQFIMIQTMAKNLRLDSEIQMVPTVREKSGLALSSRNQYLNDEEKKMGLTLSQTLNTLKEQLLTEGYSDSLSERAAKLKSEDEHWNYLEIRDASDLSQPNDNTEKYAILGAYQIRTTRLLDNLLVEKPH